MFILIILRTNKNVLEKHDSIQTAERGAPHQISKKFNACCFFQKSGVALQKIDAVEQKGVRIGVSLAPFFAKSN